MIVLLVCVLSVQTASANILFQDDNFATVYSGGILINSNDSYSGDIAIQFGSALGKSIAWSAANTRFEINAGLDMGNYELSTARVENVAALPGGAGGLGLGGTGRIVSLTVTDSIAPGCTSPSCTPGTYSWNGSIWTALTGNTTVFNSTKIITVGPTGRDYTNIADGAAYLNTLSGGEMWVDPGSYPVTTSINLANIKVRGTDTALTTLAISGGGQLEVINTIFETLTININSGITAPMGLDVTYSAASNSALQFNQVDFIVGAGKVGIDNSTPANKPVTIFTFNQCTESAGTGNLINAVASSNINATSVITVINLLSTNPLKISDWPVTIIGGSNVVTDGTITTVPDRTILVSPGMNIQGAIDSLGANGGVVKLLIGSHDITTSILINYDNIVIVGEGPGTMLRAQTATWTGGTTIADAVIQVGASNGTSPRSNVIIRDFKMEVGPNIHGIRINGGVENKVLDMIVQSIGVKNTTRTGIVITDAAASAGRRFTATRNIINNDIGTNRWVDGIHFDGGTEGTLPGQLFGYNNNIFDSIISENIVAEAKETSFAFTNIRASGIFSNRARDLGWNTNAMGLFVNNAQDITVINNTIDDNNNTPTTGIILYSDVVNAVVIGNTIRGSVGTCSPPGSTDCLINIGINVSGATGGNVGNTVTDNHINAAVTPLQDNGTATKLESNYHAATADPTANDDIADGYGIGTLWINTSSGNVYICVNSAPGAAVWSVLTGGGGHTQNTDTGTTSNTFTLDSDNTGGNVDLVYGTTNNRIIRWDNAAGEFTTVNGGFNADTYLKINGGTAITGHLSATVNNVASPNISARTCVDYGTITVTGAAVGDIAVATPTPLAGGIETVNLTWTASVTAANTVTIRVCNVTNAPINTANTQTWRADVWKH